MWFILFCAVAVPAGAEIVIKSDGMFSMRMTSESCRPKHSRFNSDGTEYNAANPNNTTLNPSTTIQLNSGACGWYNKRQSLRIAGGDIYPANEFPFISALVKCTSAVCVPFCGGSILTSSHILTAAHCLDELDKTVKLFVLVGAHDISKQSSSIEVRSKTPHPSYDRHTLTNDIALLTLKKPITFSRTVGPVCLPSSDVEEGEQVKILGWGAEKYKGPMSSKPKEMNSNVISTALCSKQWPCVKYPRPVQICTHSKDATPCQGDSGGPVVWLNPQSNQYTLVGIVSFGPQCTESKAAVNTRVTAFLPWIDQLIQRSSM